MHSALFSTIAVAAMVRSAAGTVHTVQVGEGGLKFVPDSIQADVGDTVLFNWANGGHSVAQGAFKSPCVPSGSNAFYSGILQNKGETFALQINSTDPIYYYCSIPSHCTAGMVGAINPASGESSSDFANAATQASTVTSPDQVQGGAVDASSSASSSASSGSSSSMSASSSGSSTASSSATTTGSAASSSSYSSTSGSPTVSSTGTVPAESASPQGSTTPTGGAAPRAIGAGALALMLGVVATVFAYNS